jgi:ABC-type branched-subunit amino acid transport system substrate-binding protein
VRPQIRTVAAVAAIALLAAGCSRSGSSSSGNPQAPVKTSQTTAGDFGSLKGVCQPGTATGATGQGVTSSQITVGVLTDEGFTKLPDLANAATVFTSWCNAAGGINGRKLVAAIGDTQLLQVVQAMAAACAKDFALVGNSEALDGLAVKTRLNCLLPEFPAQTVMPQNIQSSLQAYVLNWGHSYSPYAGYYNWLIKQAYPDSAKHVAFVYAQSPISIPIVAAGEATIKAEGGTVAYNGAYPATGVTDWTPYAEAIKAKGIKGFVFDGEFTDLAKLELALTNMNYKLDWIDANSNAYGQTFIHLAGKVLTFQHNYAALSGIYPLEKASANPASSQLVSLFAKYAPGQPVTLQAVQAFSSWLLFAKAAEACGTSLTRKCVFSAALGQTAWDGGGLQSTVDLSKTDAPPPCYNVEVATPAGWQPASFGANNGAYACGGPVFKVQGSYWPSAASLSDVGKSMSDLK